MNWYNEPQFWAWMVVVLMIAMMLVPMWWSQRQKRKWERSRDDDPS